MGLSRLWGGWQSALVIVKPETVIRWHRKGFQLFWRRKFRSGNVGLGLGWIFAWIRRPRLSTGLTAAAMVVALAACAIGTRVPRDALRSGPLQPLRESVLLTRGTLDPFAPENDGIITSSFKRGPSYYDPLLVEIETMSEMRQLMRLADQTGAVLYVNLGKPRAAKAAHPDLFALVKDSTRFELVTTLYGFEPRGIRTIYRYREAGRP